jgi:peroxiredoxin Q/BCP
MTKLQKGSTGIVTKIEEDQDLIWVNWDNGEKLALLADVDKTVSKQFGVWGKKQFMGREYMGVTRSTFLIDGKGKIFKIYPKVKPAGHSKEVLDDFLKLN